MGMLFCYALALTLISGLTSCRDDKLANLQNDAKEIQGRRDSQIQALSKAQKQVHVADEKVKSFKNAREQADEKYNQARTEYENALKQVEQDKQKALLLAQTQAQQDKQSALAQAQAQAQQDKQSALAQAQAQALQAQQNALAQAQAQALQAQQNALAQAQAQAQQDKQKAQDEADEKERIALQNIEVLRQKLEAAQKERLKAIKQEELAELEKTKAHEKVKELEEATRKSKQESLFIAARIEAEKLARRNKSKNPEPKKTVLERSVKSVRNRADFGPERDGFTQAQLLCQRVLILLKSKNILDEDKSATLLGADGQNFSLPRLDQLVALAGGKDDNHCHLRKTSLASQGIRKNLQATLAKCFELNVSWDHQDEVNFQLLLGALDRDKDKYVVCKGSYAGISYDNPDNRNAIKQNIIPSLRSAIKIAFNLKRASDWIFQSGLVDHTDDIDEKKYDLVEAPIERSLDVVMSAKDLIDIGFLEHDIIYRVAELNKPVGMPKVVRILSCDAPPLGWQVDNGLVDFFKLLGKTKGSNVSVYFGALGPKDPICTRLNQSHLSFLYRVDDNPTNTYDTAWRELHAEQSLSCISFLSGSPFQSRLCAPLLQDLNLAGSMTLKTQGEDIKNPKRKKPPLGNIGEKIMLALKHIDRHGYTEGKLYALSYNKPLEAFNSSRGAGVLQTPDIRVWDIAKSQDESKQSLTENVAESSCPGGYNEVFKLCRCKMPEASLLSTSDAPKKAGCYAGTRCEEVGAAGEALCTRPQDTFWIRIYDEMIKAQYFIDFSSLDMASKNSHTREAILSAMEYLAKAGRSVLVRMIFGDNSGQLQGTEKLTEEIIERTKKYPQSKLKVYVSSICARDENNKETSFGLIPKFAAWTTWAFDLVPGESHGVSPCQVSGLNHAKIIVRDGKSLTEGGVNLYEAITNTNPVFDLALNIRGPAALYSSMFLDVLWSKSCQSNFMKNVYSTSTTGIVRPHDCPPQARDYLRPIWRNNEHGAKSPNATMPVISVGRLGAAESGKHRSSYFHDQVGENTHVNPSDAATTAMLGHATKSIKIAQQSLHQTPPARVLHKVSEKIKWGGLPANEKYIATLCKTMLESKAGISVDIIISNEAALVNGSGAYYSASKLDTFNAIFDRCMLTTSYPASQKKLAKRLCDHLRVMSVGFTKKDLWKPGHPQWTGHGDNQQIALHSKVVIADDEAAYVGSHNLYPMELQEHGNIILGEDNVRLLLKEWWDNISENAVLYDPKLEKNKYCN